MNSPVTCISSEKYSGHIVIAGFADGFIRMYDRRLSPKEWYFLLFNSSFLKKL